MVFMPPGSQTGVYYIPTGNLPWNTTWRQFKDHARNTQPDGSGFNVIHAHVYAGPTSGGWISVQGLDDFRAVLNHLNHCPMEVPGRSPRILQADGRNENIRVHLKDEISPASSPARSPIRHQTSQQYLQQSFPQFPITNNMQDCNNEWGYQNPYPTGPLTAPPTPMSPSFSETSFYQPPSPHYNYTPQFNAFVPQNMPPPPGVFLMQMPPMQPVYVMPVEQQHHNQQPLLHHPQPQPQSQLPFSAPIPYLHPSPRTIKTEARKIIITGLPHHCSEKDLQELINRVSSTPSPSPSPRSRHRNSPDGTRYYLQHLELAKHSNSNPKGHAFAVLESHSTAKRTIDSLNGMDWNGRTLRARFVKEGVETRGRENRHGRRTDVDSNRPRNLHNMSNSSSRQGKAHIPQIQVPRSMAAEPHYQYTGDRTMVNPSEYITAQFANIQIDYRGDPSLFTPTTPTGEVPYPTLPLSRAENDVPEGSNLSTDGEIERTRKMLSDEAGSNTPMVVDGSCISATKRWSA